MLFLTENYAALEVFKHYLVVQTSYSSVHVAGARGLEGPGLKEGGDRGVEGCFMGPKKTGPFILFGSSFPKDKEYTQVCVR